jgi:hypothetical protein
MGWQRQQQQQLILILILIHQPGAEGALWPASRGCSLEQVQGEMTQGVVA